MRRFRSEQGLRPGQKVPAMVHRIGAGGHEPAIRLLARLDQPGDGFAATATLLTEGLRVELELSGTIDVAAERRRLDKALAAAAAERDQATVKLGNEAFLANAPEPIVAKIRARLAAAEADLERLSGQLDAMPTA
ncbi:hypothetical protein BH20ACT5_BH20ACT5_04090 [soil metagenome]